LKLSSSTEDQFLYYWYSFDSEAPLQKIDGGFGINGSSSELQKEFLIDDFNEIYVVLFRNATITD